jgi:chromate transporter
VEALPKPAQLAELAALFLKLGCISFGGPVAHLGYFHEEFVRRRHWLDEAHYSDLVALCNFLPGPASSQTVFAIGMERAGLAGALVASLAFLLPSTVLMILCGYGFSALGDPAAAGWLHGLKIAAAAVVAQAVWNMARRLCPDFPRALLALAAAAFVIEVPGAYAQIGALTVGLAVGLFFLKGSSFESRILSSPAKPDAPTPKPKATTHRAAAAALVLYAALLFILPVLAAGSGARSFKVFASIYRAGALVFGGGHVVLPLLRAEVVPPGWIGDGPFLAGYGAAQALPGPLFSFAAYLGTVIFAGPRAWLGGLLCLFAIYLPAWLVIGGALPFWQALRGQSWAQGALRGANAAVVGVLLAALINPIGVEAVGSACDLAAVLAGLLLLETFRVPPWAVVLLAAALGKWI